MGEELEFKDDDPFAFFPKVPLSPLSLTTQLHVLVPRVSNLETRMNMLEKRAIVFEAEDLSFLEMFSARDEDYEKVKKDIVRVEEKIDRLWRWLQEEVESVLDLDAGVAGASIILTPGDVPRVPTIWD